MNIVNTEIAQADKELEAAAEVVAAVSKVVSEKGFNLTSKIGCTLDRSSFLSAFKKKFPNTLASWSDVCGVLQADGYLVYESCVDGYRVIKGEA